MSSVKTSVNPIVVVAALAVIAALVLGVGPKVRDALKDDDAVIVSVDFIPDKRSGERAAGRTFPDVVTIEVNEGGTMHRTQSVTRSPWQEVFHPTRTTSYVVSASQVYGSNIGCVIQRGRNVESQDRKSGAATVTCKYTFRP